MPQTDERRRGDRIQTWFEVLHCSPTVEGTGKLHDLSPQGAHVDEASVRPRTGSPVRIYVRVPDRRQPLDLVGRVVRHTDGGFAIEYEKDSSEVAHLLEALDVEAPPGEAQTGAGAGAAAPGRDRPSPAIREIPVHGYADGDWIAGRICMPPRRSLVDHLNQDDPFLRIRAAGLPGARQPLPFLALRSDALSVVLPGAGERGIDRAQQVGNYADHRILCLLRGGTLTGQLQVLDKLRVSDHLMRNPGFLALRQCRIALPEATGAFAVPNQAEIALVNTGRVIGVAELS